MRSAVKKQKQRLVLWIAAALFAVGLAGSPLMTGAASADCVYVCIGTSGVVESIPDPH